MSIIYPEWDSVRETALNGAKRKLLGVSTHGESNNAMGVYNEELILTRAVLPITCEASKTKAEIAANGVDTSGKLVAILLPCLTLVHVCKGNGGKGKSSDSSGEAGFPKILTTLLRTPVLGYSDHITVRTDIHI